MEFYLTLGNTWDIIYNGVIKTIFDIFFLTIPQMIREVLGFTGFADPIYNVVYALLNEIPIGDTTLANVSLFSMMFGVAVGFVIIYNILKWIAPHVLD